MGFIMCSNLFVLQITFGLPGIDQCSFLLIIWYSYPSSIGHHHFLAGSAHDAECGSPSVCLWTEQYRNTHCGTQSGIFY